MRVCLYMYACAGKHVQIYLQFSVLCLHQVLCTVQCALPAFTSVSFVCTRFCEGFCVLRLHQGFTHSGILAVLTWKANKD